MRIEGTLLDRYLTKTIVDAITKARKPFMKGVMKDVQILDVPITKHLLAKIHTPLLTVCVGGDPYRIPVTPSLMAMHYNESNQTVKTSCNIRIRAWHTRTDFRDNEVRIGSALYMVRNRRDLYEYVLDEIHESAAD